MSEENPLTYEVAVRDFKRARKQAAVQHLLAQLSGRSNELLAYGDVYKQLGGEGTIERGIQEIPLKAIVGSVGRYDDFTRDFLPKKDSIQERWARVKTLIFDMAGMGPISVYQIGDVYFVRDGNHRVSVARQLGTPTISALVTEVKTKVPLAIDDDMNEVQRKARYADFLKKTKLDEWRPDADLQLTFCKNYHVFYSQIDAHRHKSGNDNQATIPYEEAAAKWYDQIYLPVAEIIREQGIMQFFPERTEADMYLLFVEHQDELESALGWHIDPDSTVVNMLEEKTGAPHSVLEWLGLQLYETFLPDQLHAGPEAGHWRKMHLARRKHDTLFAHILVGVPQTSQGWRSLDHAFAIAKREQSYIYGLHVIKKTKSESPASVDELRSKFDQRCQAEAVEGELAVETGDIAETILKRAAWVDLVVVSLTHPPKQTELSSGLELVSPCLFNVAPAHCWSCLTELIAKWIESWWLMMAAPRLMRLFSWLHTWDQDGMPSWLSLPWRRSIPQKLRWITPGLIWRSGVSAMLHICCAQSQLVIHFWKWLRSTKVIC